VSDLARRAEALVLALMDRDAVARTAVLDAECAGEPALRAEVESLLAHLIPDEGFLSPDSLHTLREDAIDGTLEPGARVGRYTVQRVLGSGGMGVVYVAEQDRPRRVVALKVLRRSLATRKLRRRFELEAELLGRLQHPGIAQIFEAHPGDDVTPPFISMELIDGRPLTEFASARRLSVPARLDLLARVCDAVQHAHQRGVIHRDLKPANILVDPTGHARVLDFGVARSLDSDLSHTTLQADVGQLVGTLAYMSPEQVAGTRDEVDTRADVYALGVMLYQLLAGKLPLALAGRSLPEAARIVLDEQPARLGIVDPQFSGAIESVASRALEKDRTRRYQSAADLATDLRRLAADEPLERVLEAPATNPARPEGGYRRAAVGASVAAVLLAILAGYAFYERHAERSSRVAMERALAATNIERARLLGREGEFDRAERALWGEALAFPDRPGPRWALLELYGRYPVRRTLEQVGGGATAVAVARGGLGLVAAADNTVYGWNLATGAPEFRLVTTAPASALQLTADGQYLLATGTDGTVRLWIVKRNEVDLTHTHPAGQTVAAMSADASVIVSGGKDGPVVVTRRIDAVTRTLLDARSPVRAIDVDEAGRHAVVVLSDGTLTAVRVADGARLWSTAPRAAAGPARFVPGGTTVVASDADGTLHEWAFATGDETATWATDVSHVVGLDVASDGDLLAVVGAPHLELWRRSSRTRVARLAGDGSGWADASIAPATNEVLVAERSGRVRLWDAAGAAADRRVVQLDAGGVAATSTASLWAAADRRGHVALYDGGSDSPRWVFPKASGVSALAVDPRGTWVAAATFGGVTVWSTTTGEVKARLSAATAAPAALVTSGDGRVLAEATGGHVRVWSVDGAQLISSFDVEQPALALALSKAGTRVAIGQSNGVQIHRAGAGAVSLRTRGAPRSLAFAASGDILAVGDTGGTVGVYSTSDGRALASMTGHEGAVTAAAFLPDGVLLTAGRDGTLRLWDAKAGEALAIVAEGARPIVAAGPLDSHHVASLDEAGAMTVLDLRRYEACLAGNREWFLAQR
jgi:WD40 repeat protein/tRNA A-37 threonylcarbamoyl transferase component Bud32